MQTLTLRTAPIKENDRLVTLLSKESGVIRAFANGAKKPNNPLHGATQPFAHGQMDFRLRRDTYTITEAQAEGLFFHGLAADITRLALANYFAALCIELCPQEEPAPEQLRLMLNALHFLSVGTRPQPLLKSVVELRLLSLAGYMPDSQDSALRFLCDEPLERAFRLSLPEESLQALAQSSQRYLRHQTGKHFDELEYYENLLRQAA